MWVYVCVCGGGGGHTQAVGAYYAFLRCCQHNLLSNYLSVKTCTNPYVTSKLKDSNNQDKLLGEMSKTDGRYFSQKITSE